MSLTLSDRDTAGAAYAAAVTTLISTLVTLKATEIKLSDQQGMGQLPGGQMGGAWAAVDWNSFAHPKYLPHPGVSVSALVEAAIQS
jgi:hypothetical protein